MSTPSSPPESAEKLSPRAFDEYASAYDQAINQGLRFTGEAKEYFAETRLKWTREVLGEYWQPGWNCLDYGCGIGAATPFLHNIVEAGKVWGVDTSAESCELARRMVCLLGEQSLEPYHPAAHGARALRSRRHHALAR